MPRSTRSDIDALLQEARAIEVLANEVEVAPDRIQEYWLVAADLITLVAEIEDLQRSDPHLSYNDPALLMLRRRLREISSRLTELSWE